MRKIIFTTAAAALGLGLSASAFAQADAPFTGPRVEAIIGYDNIQDGSDGVSEGGDGLLYGGGIGFDFQAGGFVVGAEGEITGSTADSRSTGVILPGDSFRIDAGRDLYVGGRVGIAAAPQILAYLKGGYTNQRVESRYALGTGIAIDKSNLDGFRVGAGLEYQMGPRTYVKAEYRYSNYGDVEGFDIDADRHQGLAGVGFRF